MQRLNPFAKHDVSEFEGVLIPLAQARHRNSIVLQHRTPHNRPAPEQEANEKSSNKDSHENSDGHSDNNAPSFRGGATVPGDSIGLTIEDLRAEVEMDLAANDTHSSYDSKSRVAVFTMQHNPGQRVY